MSNIIVTCLLLLLICKIKRVLTLSVNSNVQSVDIFRVHKTNRALTDHQSPKQCTGSKLNLYIPSGVKFFWSGFGVQKSEKVAAEIVQYIAKKDRRICWTLGSILNLKQNQHIRICEWTSPIDFTCEKFWHDVSCEYATKARGDIRFIFGPQVTNTSNWVRIESRQIKYNQQNGQCVYGFEQYDLHTIYCKEMKNYPTEYPDIKNEICARS